MTQQRGFTLIEVLVAATILFLVVTTAMVSFQTAMEGTQKASRFLQLTKVIEPVKQNIKQHLLELGKGQLQAKYQGEQHLAAVNVSWEATQVESAPPPERFDPNREMFTQYKKRYYLYLVELTLTQGDLTRQFEYEQLVWQERLEVQQ
ncbi:MAG: type II secretion system protein [Pseudomonadota bacterium]